jgi:hypothetical protein
MVCALCELCGEGWRTANVPTRIEGSWELGVGSCRAARSSTSNCQPPTPKESGASPGELSPWKLGIGSWELPCSLQLNFQPPAAKQSGRLTLGVESLDVGNWELGVVAPPAVQLPTANLQLPGSPPPRLWELTAWTLGIGSWELGVVVQPAPERMPEHCTAASVPTRIEARNRTCRPREVRTDAHRAEPIPPRSRPSRLGRSRLRPSNFALPSARFRTDAPRLAPIVGPPAALQRSRESPVRGARFGAASVHLNFQPPTSNSQAVRRLAFGS